MAGATERLYALYQRAVARQLRRADANRPDLAAEASWLRRRVYRCFLASHERRTPERRTP